MITLSGKPILNDGMNIFVTNQCPVESAKNLDDKRVVKMVLESAQMLSTAMHVMCRQTSAAAPYKKTHENHPCSIWARQSYENYTWLTDHFEALCNEYTVRYNKTHKCAQYINTFRFYGSAARLSFPKNGLTPFANCTNYKTVPDTIEAYRMQMNLTWMLDKRAPTWKNGAKPNW